MTSWSSSARPTVPVVLLAVAVPPCLSRCGLRRSLTQRSFLRLRAPCAGRCGKAPATSGAGLAICQDAPARADLDAAKAAIKALFVPQTKHGRTQQDPPSPELPQDAQTMTMQYGSAVALPSLK